MEETCFGGEPNVIEKSESRLTGNQNLTKQDASKTTMEGESDPRSKMCTNDVESKKETQDRKGENKSTQTEDLFGKEELKTWGERNNCIMPLRECIKSENPDDGASTLRTHEFVFSEECSPAVCNDGNGCDEVLNPRVCENGDANIQELNPNVCNNIDDQTKSGADPDLKSSPQAEQHETSSMSCPELPVEINNDDIASTVEEKIQPSNDVKREIVEKGATEKRTAANETYLNSNKSETMEEDQTKVIHITESCMEVSSQMAKPNHEKYERKEDDNSKTKTMNDETSLGKNEIETSPGEVERSKSCNPKPCPDSPSKKRKMEMNSVQDDNVSSDNSDPSTSLNEHCGKSVENVCKKDGDCESSNDAVHSVVECNGEMERKDYGLRETTSNKDWGMESGLGGKKTNKRKRFTPQRNCTDEEEIPIDVDRREIGGKESCKIESEAVASNPGNHRDRGSNQNCQSYKQKNKDEKASLLKDGCDNENKGKNSHLKDGCDNENKEKKSHVKDGCDNENKEKKSHVKDGCDNENKEKKFHVKDGCDDENKEKKSHVKDSCDNENKEKKSHVKDGCDNENKEKISHVNDGGFTKNETAAVQEHRNNTSLEKKTDESCEVSNEILEKGANVVCNDGKSSRRKRKNKKKASQLNKENDVDNKNDESFGSSEQPQKEKKARKDNNVLPSTCDKNVPNHELGGKSRNNSSNIKATGLSTTENKVKVEMDIVSNPEADIRQTQMCKKEGGKIATVDFGITHLITDDITIELSKGGFLGAEGGAPANLPTLGATSEMSDTPLNSGGYFNEHILPRWENRFHFREYRWSSKDDTNWTFIYEDSTSEEESMGSEEMEFDEILEDETDEEVYDLLDDVVEPDELGSHLEQSDCDIVMKNGECAPVKETFEAGMPGPLSERRDCNREVQNNGLAAMKASADVTRSNLKRRDGDGSSSPDKPDINPFTFHRSNKIPILSLMNPYCTMSEKVARSEQELFPERQWMRNAAGNVSVPSWVPSGNNGSLRTREGFRDESDHVRTNIFDGKGTQCFRPNTNPTVTGTPNYHAPKVGPLMQSITPVSDLNSTKTSTNKTEVVGERLPREGGSQSQSIPSKKPIHDDAEKNPLKIKDTSQHQTTINIKDEGCLTKPIEEFKTCVGKPCEQLPDENKISIHRIHSHVINTLKDDTKSDSVSESCEQKMGVGNVEEEKESLSDKGKCELQKKETKHDMPLPIVNVDGKGVSNATDNVMEEKGNEDRRNEDGTSKNREEGLRDTRNIIQPKNADVNCEINDKNNGNDKNTSGNETENHKSINETEIHKSGNETEIHKSENQTEIHTSVNQTENHKSMNQKENITNETENHMRVNETDNPLIVNGSMEQNMCTEEQDESIVKKNIGNIHLEDKRDSKSQDGQLVDVDETKVGKCDIMSTDRVVDEAVKNMNNDTAMENDPKNGDGIKGSMGTGKEEPSRGTKKYKGNDKNSKSDLENDIINKTINGYVLGEEKCSFTTKAGNAVQILGIRKRCDKQNGGDAKSKQKDSIPNDTSLPKQQSPTEEGQIDKTSSGVSKRHAEGKETTPNDLETISTKNKKDSQVKKKESGLKKDESIFKKPEKVPKNRRRSKRNARAAAAAKREEENAAKSQEKPQKTTTACRRDGPNLSRKEMSHIIECDGLNHNDIPPDSNMENSTFTKQELTSFVTKRIAELTEKTRKVDDDIKHIRQVLKKRVYPRDKSGKIIDHCLKCGKFGVNLRRCARCEVAMYCSKECQCASHSEHKQRCVFLDTWFRAQCEIPSTVQLSMATFLMKMVRRLKFVPDPWMVTEGCRRALLVRIVRPITHMNRLAVSVADMAGDGTVVVFCTPLHDYYKHVPIPPKTRGSRQALPFTATPIPLQQCLQPGMFVLVLSAYWNRFEDNMIGIAIHDLSMVYFIDVLCKGKLDPIEKKY